MPPESSLPQKRVRFSDIDSLASASGNSAQVANGAQHGGAAPSRGDKSMSRGAGTPARSQAALDTALVSANKHSKEGGLSDAMLDSESAVSLRRALLAAEAEAVLTSSSSDEDDPAVQEVAVSEPDEAGVPTAPQTGAVPVSEDQTPLTQPAAEPEQTEDAEDAKVDVGGPEDLLSPPVQPQATSVHRSVASTLPVQTAMPGSSMPRTVPGYAEDAKQDAPQPAAAAARGADALAMAAAEEEQLRAEMEDEQKQGVQPQEPPDSPVQYSKDPWAHDAW